MSTSTTMTDSAVSESVPTQRANPPASRPKPDKFKTIDGLLRSHATDADQGTLFAYPVKGVSDFEEYTARDLDRFTDGAVAKYISHGIQPADPTLTKAPVMALLAPSGLEVMISIFALNRLGYAILFLSTRLSAEAYARLLQLAGCDRMIASSAFGPVAQEVQKQAPCELYPFLAREDFRHVQNPPQFTRPEADPDKESHKMAYIIHSSGSTGHPKPIFLTNIQTLANWYKGFGLRAFCVSPLFHSQCLMECGRALYAKKPMFLGNYSFPVTTQNLIEAMSVAKPELFGVVPYVLKLMAERKEGIAQLRRAKIVLYAGSACPDALGDKLVAEGVNLVGNYGATETGFIMDSFRPPGDKEWDYLRLYDPIAKHVLMDEISSGVFECVGLDGLPSKGPSNSDTPPNSFRTRDLFTRHPDPDKSNWYKYLSRLDDRLTLVNGEKVLPLPIEGRIRQDPLVDQAAVFGAGRSVPGVIIFRNDQSASLSNDDFMSMIRPSIHAANAAAETFSRVPDELVILMPADTVYPKTDKGTFIRAQLYNVFASVIDAAYDAFEAAAPVSSTHLKSFSVSELEEYLMQIFETCLNTPLSSTTADIFSAGIDSLQATRLYSLIRRELDLGSNAARLSSNVVFEKGTVAALARHLYALRTNETEDTTDDITTMQSLIKQFSTFTPHKPDNHPTPAPNKSVILLTGATGSLGAYIISTLLSRPDVRHIYALVRASDEETATTRVHTQLTSRSLNLTPTQLSRLTCLPSDLTLPSLGLPPHHLTSLLTSLTHIIHAAWPVNFTLSLPTFTPALQGLHNLIQLSLSVHLSRPASFYFCSSVSTVSSTPRPATITETPIPSLTHAQHTGYGRSKLVAERITLAAARQFPDTMTSRVLRIGQLSGDTQHGRWNDTEAIALLIRSALSTGCLPALDEEVSWLPVDVCAEACVSIALGATPPFSSSSSSSSSSAASTGTQTNGTDGNTNESIIRDGPETVYNVLNPTTLHFTRSLLPLFLRAFAEHPLLKERTIETVSPVEWLERLRKSDPDPGRNPSVKLLGFWEGKYGQQAGAKMCATVESKVEEGDGDGMRGKEDEQGLRFETTKTLKRAPVMGWARKEVMLAEGTEGYVAKLVGRWAEAWGLKEEQEVGCN